MAETYRIRGRMHPETLQRYETMRETLGFPSPGADNAFIEWLLAHAKNEPTSTLTPEQVYAALALTAEERMKVNDALATGNASLSRLLKTGLLGESGRSIEHAKRLANVDLRDANARARVRGGGYSHVAQVVEDMKARNIQAKEWHEKTYITPSIVAKATGTARKGINEYFADHAAELAEHHRTVLGITTPEEGVMHNRQLHLHRRWDWQPSETSEKM